MEAALEPEGNGDSPTDLGEGTSRLISLVRRQGETVTLSLSGALDALSVDALGPTLHELVQQDTTRLVIDLRGLRLLDTRGLRALLGLRQTLDARGASTVVQGARAQPLAVLQVLKLDVTLAEETPDQPVPVSAVGG